MALGDLRYTVGRELKALGANRRGRATTRKTSWPSRLLKKTFEDPGEAPERRHRAVVAR